MVVLAAAAAAAAAAVAVAVTVAAAVVKETALLKGGRPVIRENASRKKSLKCSTRNCRTTNYKKMPYYYYYIDV